MKKGAICGFLFITLILSHGLADAECIVIVNKSVVDISLTERDVKLIFLGKKIKWLDGKKIHKAGLLKGPVHEEFLNKYIHKSPSSYSSFWRLMIVTGAGIPPKSFKTEKEVIRYVAEKEGAIGYISSPTDHKGIKVLTIK